MLGQNIDKLIANGVCKDFLQGNKVVHVLKGVSAEFEKGNTYAITGVSGAGKSTLMHVLGGLDSPSCGTITFRDQNLYELRPSVKEKLLNQDFGFVFQFHYLIKEFTVLENIVMVGLIKGESRKKCIARADELLVQMGLFEKRDSYPSQLSGGQQQRVAIARAIFNKPSFLLADEPTGNLDHENAMIVIDLMIRAKDEWGMGLIVCSHDPDVYNRMNTIYTFHDGIIVKK